MVHASAPSPAAPSAALWSQATANGFGLVDPDSVFRVCDQPHPVLVGSVVQHCCAARIDDAYEGMSVGRAGSGAGRGGMGRLLATGLQARAGLLPAPVPVPCCRAARLVALPAPLATRAWRGPPPPAGAVRHGV